MQNEFRKMVDDQREYFRQVVLPAYTKAHRSYAADRWTKMIEEKREELEKHVFGSEFDPQKTAGEEFNVIVGECGESMHAVFDLVIEFLQNNPSSVPSDEDVRRYNDLIASRDRARVRLNDLLDSVGCVRIDFESI